MVYNRNERLYPVHVQLIAANDQSPLAAEERDVMPYRYRYLQVRLHQNGYGQFGRSRAI